MDGFLLLLGLGILALPVVAIAALVLSIGNRKRLAMLDQRFGAIEYRLAGLAGLAPPSAAPPEVVPAPPAPEPVRQPEPIPQAEPAPPSETTAEGATGEPAPPATTPAPVAAPIRATTPRMSLEERLGTQWAVWVGGIALALGGIFLVRYSIEAGLLGPRVRIALGALLALALIAAGEWARRTERLAGIAGLPSAHIPSILTAAGTVVAFADVYAAYALYGFLNPGIAFLLLGAVALATLAAALLHGPALAGLGLAGAYVTPLLIDTTQPDYWSLYIYLAVVTAAAFGLARIRMWRWLAITAIVASAIWTLPGLDEQPVAAIGAHAFHVVAGFVLASLLIVSGLLFGPQAEPDTIDEVSSASLGAYLAVAGLLVLASRHDPVALATFAVLTAATVAIAWRTAAAMAAVPLAALLATLVMLRWALGLNTEALIEPSGPVAGAVPEPELARTGWHLTLGIGFAALFGIAGYLAQGRAERPIVPVLWSAASVFTPLAMLAALYYRIANVEQSLPFAGAALLLAALFALATETLGKRAPRPGSAAAEAIFATGAVAGLALAFTLALERGWLTVALALMVPGIAWVQEKRPLPALRWLCAIIGALVVLRIGWMQHVVGRDVGATPIFNWLLYGYGIPAAAFWLGGWLLRRRADDRPARMIEAGALLLTVLTVFLEIRHYIYRGDIYYPSAGLTEVELQVSAGLAMTIGLEHIRRRTGSVVHNIGALVLAALTLCGIVFGLGIAQNPLLHAIPVGGPFVNLILLGYGLPAILTAILALHARGVRPPEYSAAAAIVAVGLALAYLTLEVRTLFHGEILTRGPTTDAEGYTYSAVWLAFGVVLLITGMALKSQAVRLASAAVVILTVCKVFLLDIGGLTGIWQSLSFLGLGAVLLGIGWLYQRLLFPRRPRSA
ncbi:MAG: DUF2339 domain-containing protein [Xanthobacteraceae bacterium]